MSEVVSFEDEVKFEAWKSKVLRRAGGQRSAHVHSMVADLAKEMTLVTYENVMSDNKVRANWKAKHPGATELALQASFVRKYWRGGVAPAKAALAAMLANPAHSALHSAIHEALVLDNTLVRGRTTGVEQHGN